MKKVFSFILIALTLLSCVVFSACGNKYKNMKIRIMSKEGEAIERVDFSIVNGEVEKQTIKVSFSGIDKEDVGQIKVSSYPTKLVEDSNYRYDGKSCYVDILPVRSTKNQEARLMVKHLATGKQASIELNIDEKANEIQVADVTYIVSIPEKIKDENDQYIVNKHKLDFSQVLMLSPETSTDKVYFKLNGIPKELKDVNLTKIDEETSSIIEWGEQETFDLYSGFEVSNLVENNTSIEIYPVTVYRNAINLVGNNPIKIKFKKVLNENNLQLIPTKENCADLDLSKLELIANDNLLQSIKLQLNYVEKDENGEVVKTPLIEKDKEFFEMYNIVPSMRIDSPLNIIEDANKDVVVQLQVKTENYEQADIQLIPKNYVGDFNTVSKTISVKGELKANEIALMKNGKDVENQEFDIFNYYSEGNSLGTEFGFVPYANSREPVNSSLKHMRIVIDPAILYVDYEKFHVYKNDKFSNKYGNGESLADKNQVPNSGKFSLVIHKFSEPLKFYFDLGYGKMVSEAFTETDKIFVKYANGNGTTQSTKFKLKVETLNNATKTIVNNKPDGTVETIYEYPHWSDLDPTDEELNFNLQEGIFEMKLAVGTATITADNTLAYAQEPNFEKIYLNVGEEQTNGFYYLQPKQNSVIGILKDVITKGDFNVDVVPKSTSSPVPNPLKIKAHYDDEYVYGDNHKGSNHVEFNFQNKTMDGVAFVFDNNTTIGEYDIIFKQDDEIKAIATVVVYEGLKSFTLENNIEFEDNRYVIKNYLKRDAFEGYDEFDFIVPASTNEKLKLSIVNIPQNVIDSNIISAYKFTIVSDPDFESVENNKSEYVNKSQDVNSNSTMLGFLKGTSVFDSATKKLTHKCVTINVSLQTYKEIGLAGIKKENGNFVYDDTTYVVSIKFYIYEKITSDKVNLNTTNATRYFEENLGALYKDLSKIQLSIDFAGELKNYKTDIQWFRTITKNNASETKLLDDIESDQYSETFHQETEGQTQQNLYTVKIKQFNEVVELRCIVDIKPAILTEKLVVDSDVKVDEKQNYYINLKEKETYKIEAQNVSSLGPVTFPEIIVQVFDETGSAYPAQEYFEVNQDENTIKVLSIPNEEKTFTLIIFAKDVLNVFPSGDMSGFEDPKSFIMESVGDVQNLYKNAFFEMEIRLSNGTEHYPYLITSSEDFWQIDRDGYASKYWRLEKNITLGKGPNGKNQIKNFCGRITTNEDQLLTISNVQLFGASLFENFHKNEQIDDDNLGRIENITFQVNISGDMKASGGNRAFGLFDENKGTLLRVGVNVDKNSSFNMFDNTSFGALVGVNYGFIEYKVDGNPVEITSGGVSGKFTVAVAEKAVVYIGGLVGENYGQITGCESTPESLQAAVGNTIKIQSSEGRKDALAEIEIVLKNANINSASAIGGVVGYNGYKTDGAVVNATIRNAFVNATITAPHANNVGGVIGINSQQANASIFASKSGDFIGGVTNVVDDDVVDDDDSFKNKAIFNVKSSSKIIANRSVGGIVGSDTNGLYIDCDFQILPQSGKIPSLQAQDRVGGIAGSSTNGKFFYCSTMSYAWDYAKLVEDAHGEVHLDQVIIAEADQADIVGSDYVGGILGFAQTNQKDDIYNDVMIVYSSVNAYLVAGQDKNLGGIVCHSDPHNFDPTVIYNAYFIGRLEGLVHYAATRNNVSIANIDKNVIFNIVYSINLEQQSENNVEMKQGSYKDGSGFIFTTDPGDYWGKSDGINGNYINGNYIYVSSDLAGKKPIFDIAPQDIKVTVQDDKQKTNLINNEKITNVLFLDYYDFSQNTTLSEIELKELDNHFNRKHDDNKDILKLFDIKVSPNNLGDVAISVGSANRKIVNVSQSGHLEVMGVGDCELTFKSVLNPEVKATIKVVVDYPIGDEFQLSTNKADKTKIVNRTSQVAVGFSQQYYVVTSGQESYSLDANRTTFAYRTQDNPNLNINISHSGTEISQYLKVGGISIKDLESQQGKGNVLFDLTNDTPFVVSVKTKLEGGKFNFKVKPYLAGEYKGQSYKVEYDVTSVNFDLDTAVGPTDVAFSFDDAIIYPNDLVQIFAHISTDKLLENPEDVFKMLSDRDEKVLIMNTRNYEFELVNSQDDYTRVLKINYKDNNNNTYNVGTVAIVINEDMSSWDGKIQTIEFSVQYERANEEEDDTLELTTELSFTLKMQTEYVESSANFTLIPQRINKFDVKNYYYKNVGNGTFEFVKEDILKSNQAGTIQIDLVPDNGYYSYLEISDLTGDQEILFTQVDALEHGKMVHDKDEISKDGKGIQLKLKEGTPHTTSIYVKTQIDKSYDSKIHTIEIRAYSAEGDLLYSQPHYLDVKMLPNIILEYLNPNGTTSGLAEADSSHGVASTTTAMLANGVDAEFRINVENANTELEPVLSSTDSDALKSSDNNALANKYEFIHDVNEYYVLRRKKDVEIDSSDIGKTLKLTLKTTYEHENGDVDTAECSITFTITTYVIHGVSVNNSLTNAQGLNEIYGYVGKEVPLTFYFGKDDISFYDNETQGNHFWDTEYRLKDLQNTTNDQLLEIKAILEGLNPVNGDNSSFITLDETLDESVTDDITLENNTILATGEVDTNKSFQDPGEEKGLKVEFAIRNTSTDITQPVWSIKSVEVSDEYVISKSYNLNFNKATAWYEPKVIANEQDFLEMESGLSYILARDLEFEEYTPVDLDLLEFDGNGRTIKIKKFKEFEKETIDAGLFAQVYPNMIVKNVVVEYVASSELNPISGYYDLCNGSANYSMARFGGIAAINNGVITNCHVQGSVKFRASIIEQKKVENTSGYQTNIYIGGVVSENSGTGYITNSTSRLNINSQSNIGGFAYSNKGKIASSGVVDSRIYTYNNALGNTIVVRVAGFVVDNDGEISMSYLKLNSEDKTISAKDVSAGFAYENNGKIYDSYVDMESLGFNNNAFAGFVYSNSGLVERAYTYINKGILKNISDSMFAPRESEGLINCIEFVATSYNNNIESGLIQLGISERFNKTVYDNNNFAFGDNVGAVWTMQAGSMPTLVAETEINKLEAGAEQGFLLIETKEEFDEETGVTTTNYEVNIANYGTKENPYIIHSAVDLKDEKGTVIVQNTWKLFTGEIKNIITNEKEMCSNPYFRIVKDIDFTAIGNNPETSKIRFSGNIQGNNMVLKNIMLYSVEKQESIGLFKEMVGVDNYDVENSVRNLKLTTSSVWASKTNAVGVLAGVVENFNLFNITIDSENVIMVGGNAVGGVAGVIRGEFNIDSLTSNIGANSNRATGLAYHSIYMSKNNKAKVSENLQDVYYAGAIAGIVDGYDRSLYNVNETTRNISKYFPVNHINVVGNVTMIGDLVGSAFGFIGERTCVSKVYVNISGALSGYHYSGVVAGENRGVINNYLTEESNVKIIFANNLFADSQNVSAGVVGLNIGGLVENVDVEGNIKLTGTRMAGAIVGRNINGVVANTYYDGEIFAYIASGAVAGDYTAKMFKEKRNGSGTLSQTNLINSYLIPKSRITYKEGKTTIDNYNNISLSGKAFNYIIRNISKYYIHSQDENNYISYSSLKLFGVIVGLTGYQEHSTLTVGDIIDIDSTLSLKDEESSGKIIFKASTSTRTECIAQSGEAAKFNDTMTTDAKYSDDAPVYIVDNINLPGDNAVELFLFGSYTPDADSWLRNYSGNRIIFK